MSRLFIARAYIHDNLHTRICLDAIADAACLSKYHLIRNFHRAFGAPPLRYHQTERIRAARHRVRNGEPLAIIAEDLGFADLSAFSRAYLRIHKVRPSLHRER